MSEFVAANSTLVLILGFILLALSAVLTPFIVFALQWRMVRQAEIEASVQKAEMDAHLKSEMLNRGMSAADIRQVLDAPVEGAKCNGAQAKKHWQGFAKKWGRMCGVFGKSRDQEFGDVRR
jgi:hypothetical protein